MPKHPLISIPLDIPDVRVLQTELTKDGELILTVESTLTTTTCRRCGRTITQRHGLDEPRLLRHLPSFGRVVYLRIRPKRFCCPWCDGHPTTMMYPFVKTEKVGVLQCMDLLSYTLICTQPSIEGGSTHVLRRDRPEKPAPFTRRDRLGEIVLSGRYTWGNRPLEGCAACEHQCIRTR
jgi:transposase